MLPIEQVVHILLDRGSHLRRCRVAELIKLGTAAPGKTERGQREACKAGKNSEPEMMMALEAVSAAAGSKGQLTSGSGSIRW